jgi:acyl-CoA reductase-like NAD-dependent aldehyde dehydrogenase
MLLELMEAEGVPAGLVTYVSCSIEEQRHLFRENQGSPMYFTGSRPVAAAIKEVVPKLVASTGGPNTMVATNLSDEVAAASRMSTLIENSGQCTAMRHLIVPDCTEAEVVEKIFSADSVKMIDHASEALEAGEFAAMYESHPTAVGSDSAPDGYSKHPSLPIAYKVSVYHA